MKKFLKLVSGSGPILHVLLQSKINQTIVGVHAKKLGNATYLTGVDQIMMPLNEDPLIILAGYDITGYRFENATLRLADIETVIPFATKFENPLLKRYNPADIMSNN